MKINQKKVEASMHESFDFHMKKVHSDYGAKLKNSKGFFDSFITDLVRHDQSVLPFITNWFDKCQENNKRSKSNEEKVNTTDSGQAQTSSGQSLNNLNSQPASSCIPSKSEVSDP